MDSPSKVKYRMTRRLHDESPSAGTDEEEAEGRGRGAVSPVGQLKEYLDRNVLEDEDFQMNAGVAEKLKMQG